MERKFDIVKELSLGFLGKEWEQCKASFRLLGVNELKAAAKAEEIEAANEKASRTALDRVVETVKQNFIEGTGIIGGKAEKLVAEDFHVLPPEVARKAFSLICGNVDPN